MRNFCIYLGLYAIICIGLIVGTVIVIAKAEGSGVYGSMLPSTVSRLDVGLQRFGSVTVINPVSRNVRPFDTQYVPKRNVLDNRVFRKKKRKHPEDIICNKLIFFKVERH
jgi:hypothetical protein